MEHLGERFEAWLRALPGYEHSLAGPPVAVDGGASNLTYRVALEDAPYAAVALRMQRESGIFQPYDVLREGRIIEALAGTDVPVPKLVGYEPDRGVLGAPFIVLEWVDAPHMGLAGPEASFGAFTRMVATIHSVQWRVLEVEGLKRPASAREATAAELDAVVARIEAFGLRDDPALSRALSQLRTCIPDDGQLALCQGDINVFNYLFRGGEVVAVVDWEQARIGDPRSDIGQLVALSHLKGAPYAPPRSMPFVQMYEAAAGREMQGLEFFRAFWFFQLTFIHSAWLQSNGTEPWYSREAVTGMLELALAELA